MRSSGYSKSQPEYYKLILDGISNGVKIDYNGNRNRNRRCVNLPISDEDWPKVNKVILADVAAGIKVGPFDKPPFEFFSCSPIGCVPKRTKGEIRVIHHLSHPRGGDNDSINEHTRDVPITLGSFDRATDIIKQLGEGCFLIKLDVKAAYKLVLVCEEDRALLGFMWEGKYYYERVLPFGLKSSCRIWEWFATALHFIMNKSMCIEWIVHYIDDFLIVVKNREEAMKQREKAESLCEKLDVPLAHDKSEGPVTKLTFLGIEIDTMTMTARLPEEKLSELHTLVGNWGTRTHANISELKSLEGVLQWCTKVVRPGRACLERIRQFIKEHSRISEGPHRLNEEVMRDIGWWFRFVREWNGVSLLYEVEWQHATKICLFTDACDDGYGCCLGNHWCHGKFTEEQLLRARNKESVSNTRSMPFLELLALVLAASTWGHMWKGQKICFVTDCMPVKDAMTNLRSPSNRLMRLIRHLSSLAARFQFDFKCEWIEGELNVLADHLSRSRIQEFLALVPTADPEATPVVPLPPFDEM